MSPGRSAVLHEHAKSCHQAFDINWAQTTILRVNQVPAHVARPTLGVVVESQPALFEQPARDVGADLRVARLGIPMRGVLAVVSRSDDAGSERLSSVMAQATDGTPESELAHPTRGQHNLRSRERFEGLDEWRQVLEQIPLLVAHVDATRLRPINIVIVRDAVQVKVEDGCGQTGTCQHPSAAMRPSEFVSAVTGRPTCRWCSANPGAQRQSQP